MARGIANLMLRLYTQGHCPAHNPVVYVSSCCDEDPATMPRGTRIFRIFYTSLFTILGFVLFILTLFTPADAIYQSYKSHRLGNIFIITGVYIFTLLLAIFIYASRLFTNRSVLAGIPKAWIPVEKPDVSKGVRRVVVEGLGRSAIIAQQSRPRDRTGEDNSRLDPSMTIPATGTPPWGNVSHPGWTAPDCPDLPNQQFEPVVKELPHLIEAKAVSLAPVDPRLPQPAASGRGGEDDEEHQSIPDERVVEILQRPRNMCLRDYLSHLTRLNLINPPELGRSFIRLYERSRFSNEPLTESEFRSLMGMFAEMLRGMTALDPSIIAEVQAVADEESGSIIHGGIAESMTSGDSRSLHVGRDTVPATLTSSSASFASSHRSGASRRSRYHPSNSPAASASSLILDRPGGDRGGGRRARRTSSRRSVFTADGQSIRPMQSSMSVSSVGSVVHRPQGEMAAGASAPVTPVAAPVDKAGSIHE
ncbi:hypothetical protein FQN51_003827 [Onygenales sp. PD_10]|nr:hypothetical protein FQN51_003827 [Onygenales sp. PD_10]